MTAFTDPNEIVTVNQLLHLRSLEDPDLEITGVSGPDFSYRKYTFGEL